MEIFLCREKIIELLEFRIIIQEIPLDVRDMISL